MELKVWVEGIQRIVCGVTVNTTCQDVVFALAHATGKIGRFTLIERWRNNERLLAPQENPLKILLKWGEYSNDVQFILQRSDQNKTEEKSLQKTLGKPKQTNDNDQTNKSTASNESLDRSKDTRRSFGLTETKPTENIGIVKGIPQKPVAHASPEVHKGSPTPTPSGEDNFKKVSEFNMADVRNSLDRKTNLSQELKNLSNENLLDVFNCNKFTVNSNNDMYKNSPPISSNGALVPPPYRDPPPPRNSPLHKVENSFSNNLNNSNINKKFDYKDNINMTSYFNMSDFGDLNENFFQNAQYKDLIQLIKYQREKISSQQADLTKYDAEIVYLEGKERDQAQELEALSREINKTDQIYRQGNEQLQTLQYVEEENELVRQQEKTLKSEITLLRSKLANCETELLQCKNKIRLLMDDIQIEQRALNTRQKDSSRQNMERHFMSEVEKIQAEIDLAIQNAESSSKATENLKKEIAIIETAIAEKKKQVEQLVNEMKEVNLQSLTVTPSDEIRHLLEGSNRAGSTRRIIGSPRQLENAVPTSKNPHGVWV